MDNDSGIEETYADEMSAAMKIFNSDESAKEDFNHMIKAFGKNIPYKTMIQIAHGLSIFRDIRKSCHKMFISLVDAITAAPEDYFIIFAESMKVYALFSYDNYIIFMNRQHPSTGFFTLVDSRNNIHSVEARDPKYDQELMLILFKKFGEQNIIRSGLRYRCYIFRATETAMSELLNEHTDLILNINRELYVQVGELSFSLIPFLDLTITHNQRLIKPLTNTSTKDLSPDHIQIDNFRGRYCLYLLQLNEPYEDCYKYGITGNIIERLRKHKQAINYKRVVKIFTLDDQNAMKMAETEYKHLSHSRKIAVVRLKYTEIVRTDHIDEEIDILADIVAKYNGQKPADVSEDVLFVAEKQNISFDDDGSDQPFDQDDTNPSIQWVKSNPPLEREITTIYYERYTASNPNATISTSQLGKIVRGFGYKPMRGTQHRYWVKK